MPPQLEKNHVVPTAWQDEALARDGVSREVTCSALKGETVKSHRLPSLSEVPEEARSLGSHCSRGGGAQRAPREGLREQT